MRVDAVQLKDYNRIGVEPLTGTIGAEISGVDLRELDEELIAELHDAWMDHKVLFFRDQDLTHAQHVAYGQAFGELEVHPFVRNVEEHPIVRTHPVTGRKSLYVNRTFTLAIDGMSPEECRDLRYLLYDQASKPEFQCRFRWRPGSIAQWDNRCTQHYAVPDHGGHHRRMERVTLIGDRPV